RLSARAQARRLASALCLHGDARRLLLQRIRPEGMPAPADAAGDRNGRTAARTVSRSSHAPAHADQIRLQADQAHWADRLHRYDARRLLGETWLRLVRRAIEFPHEEVCRARRS